MNAPGALTDFPQFNSLPIDIQCQVLTYLDRRTLSSIILTSHGLRFVAGVTFNIPRYLEIPVTGLSSSARSSSSQNTDEDTLASTDTEMSSPEEQNWEFKVTPEMTRRLCQLPKHKTGAALDELPTELQLEVFSHLDRIDSACLGLSSLRAYLVFRAIHGTKMPLNTRRQGPNTLEAVWEVVGKQSCRQCGNFRCELHQHIKGWMPKELEYCATKKNFGRKAPENAHDTCYRYKPSKPHRCGRHPERTTSMHQDDTHSNVSHSVAQATQLLTHIES